VLGRVRGGGIECLEYLPISRSAIGDELIFADLARVGVAIDPTPDGVGNDRPESVASAQQGGLDFDDLRLQVR
jgi:hypothetical protein